MKKTLFLALFALLGLTSAWAYNFSAVAPTGQTLYYTITSSSSHTVSVVSPGTATWSGYTQPTGSLTIPSTVTYSGTTYSVTAIGTDAFTYCTSLASVTIPNSVTSIGGSAFYNCTSLAFVTIPNSVTSIGGSAFRACYSLDSVTIPNSVTTIGNYAFYNCSGLSMIISHASVAPTLGTNAFYGVTSTIPVTIPCGSLSSYSSQWSNFSNFTESTAFSFSAVSANNTMGGVVVLQYPSCTLPNAIVQAVPAEGYIFDRWSNGTTQNPYILAVTSDTVITAMFTTYSGEDSSMVIHDTVTITYYVHDTVFVPNYIHDTTTVYDTAWMTQFDTITIHDTICIEPVYHTITLMSSNINRGMVAGNGRFPEGTEVEIAAVPIEGNVFIQWSDGNTDQIRTVTTDEDITLSATYEPRSTEGINAAMMPAWEVTAEKGVIMVKDAMGEGIRVFDVAGRLRYQGRIDTEVWRLGVSTTGAYFVQIADSPAQKVVVVE